MRKKMHQPDQVIGIVLGHATLYIVRRIEDTSPQQVGDFTREFRLVKPEVILP